VPRQIRLNLQTAGRHDAAWKRLGDTSELVTDVEQFLDGVVAELQRRGRFRTEYEYETFRGNLGVA
jgi:hypothetical protein